MEIYYLKKEEFLNSIDINSLKKFSDNREFSSEEKYLEHLCGLFLTKFIAKQVYNIKNTEIELKNKNKRWSITSSPASKSSNAAREP